jgi:hypothetical protein
VVRPLTVDFVPATNAAEVTLPALGIPVNVNATGVPARSTGTDFEMSTSSVAPVE